MEVDETAPAMDGGEMEDDVDPLDHALGHAGLEEVRLVKLDNAGVDGALDVGEAAARQVVHNADRPRPFFDQMVDQVGADERSATGDQDPLLFPIHVLFFLRPRGKAATRAIWGGRR